MKKLILVAAVAAAFAFPAGAFAGTFTGVVVGKSGANIAVASKSGTVRTVHTSAHLRIGARVRVTGAAVRVVGLAHHARIHAVVVKRVGSATLVAAGRSLLAIRSSGRRLSSLAGSGPSTGAVVNSDVDIANGQLTQQSMQVVGQTGSASVQAQVTAVGPGTITVLVNGQPFPISLPAGIQPASLVGQFVTLNLNLAQSGVTATEGDDNESENDDQDDQGDNNQGDDD
ncbi:MAG: hypothetical protein E6G09_07790 [Actinobacteria bacterium]|nr:MAG: hypothetical protein E6G09_07790 [Actinomycetota bacterium]